MTKRNYIIVAAITVAVIIIAGVAFININNKKDLSENGLLKINTTLVMNDSQKQTYAEIKDKLAIDPEDYSGLFELARLKQDMLDIEGAIALYNQLHAMKPADILPMNNLGSLYYDNKRYEEAEKIYLDVLKVTPKWINAYNSLMDIYQYHLTDKRASFEAVLLNGIKEYPEMEQTLISKTAVYYDQLMNNKVKAIEYYRKLLKFTPNDAVIKARIAELSK